MISPSWTVERLGDLGLDLYVGVPDSLMKPFCSHLARELPKERHVVAANEGAAIGTALGHYLRSGRPAVVYLQNSGFGNTVNPLLSLADREVYGAPMLLLVGWRGQPGVSDEPQHTKQGRVMTDLLDALDLPWAVLPAEQEEAGAQLAEAVDVATARSTPYVLLVEKGTFSGDTVRGVDVTGDEADLPSREDALKALMDVLGDDDVYVSTTGMLSRELFEHREAGGGSGERDFLTVGGMGHACSIAFGVALEEPEREVWCLDGDGALLMHMGSLAVIADHGPSNYFHVIFNNGVHDSVGGQPTSIDVVDIPAVARAAGYRWAARTSDLSGVGAQVAEMRAAGGPALLELRVQPGNRPDIGRPTRTPAEARDAFMTAVRDG